MSFEGTCPTDIVRLSICTCVYHTVYDNFLSRKWGCRWVLGPRSSDLTSQSSVLGPQFSVLGLQSSVLNHVSLVLGPQFSVPSSRSPILSPQFSVINPQFRRPQNYWLVRQCDLCHPVSVVETQFVAKFWYICCNFFKMQQFWRRHFKLRSTEAKICVFSAKTLCCILQRLVLRGF